MLRAMWGGITGAVLWLCRIGDEADLAHAEGGKENQPDLHIRGDKDVRYERVAQAMAAAQQAGLGKIGFVTEPPRAP